MNLGSKIIGGLAIIGVVIGASIFLGRQSRQKATEPAGQSSEHQVNLDAPPSITQGTSRPPVALVDINSSTNVIVSISTARQVVSPGTGTDLAPLTNWNERIDEALTSGAEDREVAKTLLKSFPRFPPEGKVEAVQHISNLLPDEDYPELGKLMEDAALPEDVLDELFMDLLNRPTKLMLPELVKVARNSQHAKAGEAKDFLELYLEEDYGADWNLWQRKVDEWLKANPDD